MQARMRKALVENRERVVAIPWKSGSGMAKGKDRGVLFCAAVGNRTFLRFVPVDNAWRPQADDGAIISELGSCLRIVECGPANAEGRSKRIRRRSHLRSVGGAQSHIWRAWMVETDPANLQPTAPSPTDHFNTRPFDRLPRD
jgi:hypothetical protein